ncbi:MAG: hypothetical protein ABSA30_10710, partial [Candidatus Aminicenantales bacterium]
MPGIIKKAYGAVKRTPSHISARTGGISEFAGYTPHNRPGTGLIDVQGPLDHLRGIAALGRGHADRP